jgi:hypothetical protein
MKLKSIVLIQLGLLFFLYTSCQNDSKTYKDKINYQVSDTIIQDVPLDKNGNSIYSDADRKYTDSLLGYQPMNPPYNDLQIRIRYSYVFSDSGQIVNIKKSGNHYSADLTTLKYTFNKNNDSVIAIKKVVLKKHPTSGWEVFAKKLFDLKILTLPDFRKISNYPRFADGDGVTVEIATGNQYRLYQYKEPMQASNRIWQAKNMERILKLIEQEFTFKPLRIF